MQLLLVKDVLKLGHVGDVVEVKQAYARNYLVPQRLGVEPPPRTSRPSNPTRSTPLRSALCV